MFDNPAQGLAYFANYGLPNPGYYGAAGTGEAYGYEDDPTNQFSTELRLASTDKGRLQWVGGAMRLYQQLGLQTLVRRSGVLKLFPKRLRELESMTPKIQPKFSDELISPITPAVGPKKYRVVSHSSN